MNLELRNKMLGIKQELKDRDAELRKEFEANKTIYSAQRLSDLRDEIVEVDNLFYAVRKDLADYKRLSDQYEDGKIEEADFTIYEDKLAERYNVNLYKEVEKEQESEPVEVVATKKPKKQGSKFIAGMLAGAMLLTGGYLLRGCEKKHDCGDTRSMAVIEETVNTPVPTKAPEVVVTPTPSATLAATPAPTPEVEAAIEEVVAELPFEEYGNYTDVNDEAQLRRRAEWYYNTYIADPAKPSHAGANFFSVDQIMDDMRMISGEFMQDGSGNITYNDTDMIAVANDLHTIANYDSFKQYGTQIYFTPMAPLFEDGSLAQKAAVQLDQAMEKVVAAIRAEDDEAFLAAAREWGIIVINQFNYVDFTGEYVNINQVDAPTSFALYHAMSAKYASTILEYSEGHHLNVCIPYCYDGESGELTEKALSEIMYQINEIPMDAVAERSGHKEEYEENNLSLPERLYVLAKNYFISKYDLEHGCSKVLK